MHKTSPSCSHVTGSSPPITTASSLPASSGSASGHQHHHLSHGTLIAAIVAPIAFVLILLLGGLLFYLLRRRRRGHHNNAHRLSTTHTTPEMLAAGSRFPSFAPTNPSLHFPVQFFDPRNESPFADPPTPTSAEVPVYLEPESPLIPIYLEQPLSPNPIQPCHNGGGGDGSDGLLLPPRIARPETLSRSTTECSFTSTLYSDSASVHEAREAQRVGGGAGAENPFRSGAGGERRYAYGRVPIGWAAGTVTRGVPAVGKG